MNLQYIHTIARNEAKLLRRSWMFRVFAGLTILILSLIQFGRLTNLMNQYFSSWDLTSNSSFIPLFSTFYYTIGQSIIVIFLAGGILKRNQKIDTAEVFMIRPINNSDYILGKVVGIVRVFFGLNLVPLCLGVFISLIINGSTFDIIPYIVYPICISIPSLLFILGLSFLVINAFKNQAVTSVIMLGFVISFIAYLRSPFYGLFDFMGLYIPNTFSDITGMASFSTFILQRSIYLLFAAGSICISIALMTRLANRKFNNIRYVIFAIIFIGSSLFCGLTYVNHYKAKNDIQSSYINLYKNYKNIPSVKVSTHDITFEQNANFITAQSRLSIKNEQTQKIDSFVFYLNPGLQVESVQSKQQSISFKKEKQVLVIYNPLDIHQTDSLEIAYSGILDENICYVDFPSDSLCVFQQNKEFCYGFKFLFCDQNYTLLTPEALWYPTVDAPVDVETRYDIRHSYTRYSLTVKNPQNECISQGKRTKDGNNIYFECEEPLIGLSLTMGDYECHSLQLNDSLEVAVWNIRGHNQYAKPLAIIADTLKSVLSSTVNYLISDHLLSYPFRRFSLVETPITFSTPLRNWRSYTERVQPEMILCPEHGIGLSNIDFAQEVQNMQRWQRDQYSEEEMYINALNNFINQNFNNQNNTNNTTNISPYFNAFRTFISSDECTMFDLVFIAMQEASVVDQPMFFRDQRTNTLNYVNIYLHKHSLKEAIEDHSLSYSYLYEIIKAKSNQIKYQILAKHSQNELDAFFRYFYKKHPFEQVDFSIVIDDYNTFFKTDLHPTLIPWFTDIQSPEVTIIDVNAHSAVIDDASKYIINFKVSNPSDIDAVLSTTVTSGGPGGGPGGGFGRGFGGGGFDNDNLINYFIIPAHSNQQIRFSCDDRPNRMTINTGVSANLPNDLSYSFQKVNETTTDLRLGMFAIGDKEFLPIPNEIILDNEDSCFYVEGSDQKRFLQTYFHSNTPKDEYVNFVSWHIPTQWAASISNNFYGKTIQSAMFKSVGKGLNRATWKTKIPQDNYYEIFTWYANMNMQTHRYQGPPGGPGSRNDVAKDNSYTYIIRTSRGEEKVTINYSGRESRWISLGSFFLPQEEIYVSILDKATEAFVIADAIKIVPDKKQNNNQLYNE